MRAALQAEDAAAVANVVDGARAYPSIYYDRDCGDDDDNNVSHYHRKKRRRHPM